MDDLNEFISLVGTEVPLYRECGECGDIYIVDPENYQKPKTECDPGYCNHFVPVCACRNNEGLWSIEKTEQCDFPDCTKCGECQSDF